MEGNNTPNAQLQVYPSQTTSPSPSANTAPSPGPPPDGTTVNLAAQSALGGIGLQQADPGLQTRQLAVQGGVSQSSEAFPIVAQYANLHATLQAAQPSSQQQSSPDSGGLAQVQQPTGVYHIQTQSQLPAQTQGAQVAQLVYNALPTSTPAAEPQGPPAIANQYAYVDQQPMVQQFQQAHATTVVQSQNMTTYSGVPVQDSFYQQTQTVPASAPALTGQVAYQTALPVATAQYEYIPTPSTGPVIPQTEVPFFEAPPMIAQNPASPKIWSKESAKNASKTAWRHSKNFLIKTNDMVEKAIAPIIPVLSVTDPESLAAYKLQRQLQRQLKAIQQQQQQQQGQNPQAQAQIQAQIQGLGASTSQQQLAGVDTLGPLIAALQTSAQTGATAGQPSGDGPQVALLAALLQQQIQQQQKQAGSLKNPPNRKPVQTAATSSAAVGAAQGAQGTVPGQVQGPSLESLVAALTLYNQNLQGQVKQQGNAAVQQPAQQPAQQAIQQPLRKPPQQLNPQPIPQPPPQKPLSDTLSWTHHRARVFGIQDILLPPGHSLSAQGRTVLRGNIHPSLLQVPPSAAAHFEIELLYNPLQLQRRIDGLQAQFMLLQTQQQLNQPPISRGAELNVEAAMTADCVLYRNTNTPGSTHANHLTYTTILQSPMTASTQGNGLCISALVPLSHSPSSQPTTTGQPPLHPALAVIRAMTRSIRWGDFSLVCRDVSASISGTWQLETRGADTTTPTDATAAASASASASSKEAEAGGPDGSSSETQTQTQTQTRVEPQTRTDQETETYTFDAQTSRFGHERGAAVSRPAGGGVYQVLEYENGVGHLVLTDDDPAREVGVWVVERGDGAGATAGNGGDGGEGRWLKIEGRRFLGRV